MGVISKMSEGNPGAATALGAIFKNAQRIDPQSALGPLGALCSLDTADVYGSGIWVLYSDVCGQNVSKMIALLRAAQLGFVSYDLIKEISSRQDYSWRKMIDVDAVCKQVQERLEEFVLEES